MIPHRMGSLGARTGPAQRAMELPPDSLTCTPEETVHRIALNQLGDARLAAARMEEARDAKALHNFRVAVRRLRSTLTTWSKDLGSAASPRDRKKLRAVQKATAVGRDAEVALMWVASQTRHLSNAERVGQNQLVEDLTQEKDSGYSEVSEIAARFRKLAKRLHRRLVVVQVEVSLENPRPRHAFGAALAVKARELTLKLADHLSKIVGSETGDGGKKSLREAHKARIVTKRLRYLVEPCSSLTEQANAVVGGLKALQDGLGEIQDATVLAPTLDEALASSDAARAGIEVLKKRNAERMTERLAELAKEWREGGTQWESLIQALGQLSAELDSACRAGREIERKYLLKQLPRGLDDAQVVEIDQGWLPGDQLRERIRRERENGTSHYLRTVKLGRGVERIEIEEATTEPIFKALWPLTEGCRVRKRRYRCRAHGLVWEIDEFLDRDLFLAEVELPSREWKVETPDWLAPVLVREVTDEDGYVNLRLAQ